MLGGCGVVTAQRGPTRHCFEERKNTVVRRNQQRCPRWQKLPAGHSMLHARWHLCCRSSSRTFLNLNFGMWGGVSLTHIDLRGPFEGGNLQQPPKRENYAN